MCAFIFHHKRLKIRDYWVNWKIKGVKACPPHPFVNSFTPGALGFKEAYLKKSHCWISAHPPPRRRVILGGISLSLGFLLWRVGSTVGDAGGGGAPCPPPPYPGCWVPGVRGTWGGHFVCCGKRQLRHGRFYSVVLNGALGVPFMAQGKHVWVGTMRLWVWSLAPLSGLRIWLDP